MKEKIIFVFILVLFLSGTSFGQNNKQNDNIKETLAKLEQDFGNTFFESLYSIDALRPYTIIQIDKIAAKYDNSWISPKQFVSQLNNKDKQILLTRISEFINDMNDAQKQNKTLAVVKSWCIAEKQLNLIAQKIGIGRSNILNIIMMFLPAPVNANTGEIISSETSDSNEEYYYYATINQLSNLSQKEQFRLYSKIFGELAQK